MQIDYAIFDFINQSLAHPWLDAVLPTYREKTTWIPLYLVLVVLLLREYGWRSTLRLLLCVGVAIAVADQLAASVLKPWVGRLRPCADASIADQARILVSCGGQYSFPSNHATNHFALAQVLAMTWLVGKPRTFTFLLYGWAASISLAQVYVGKHFPADIFFGALLGITIACLVVLAGRRWLRGLPGNPADVRVE
ncbi:phosphatase PAP2 family protein [Lewinella sp. W8]|uniref:phosphatase PAP2 family protein n=1 Tax=Lewinella sp. W8 TaxID=2528208 RepID=UPI0015649FEA|nr:phosphatase PAP2 family protein [Lewinella sp. W8]